MAGMYLTTGKHGGLVRGCKVCKRAQGDGHASWCAGDPVVGQRLESPRVDGRDSCPKCGYTVCALTCPSVPKPRPKIAHSPILVDDGNMRGGWWSPSHHEFKPDPATKAALGLHTLNRPGRSIDLLALPTGWHWEFDANRHDVVQLCDGEIRVARFFCDHGHFRADCQRGRVLVLHESELVVQLVLALELAHDQRPDLLLANTRVAKWLSGFPVRSMDDTIRGVLWACRDTLGERLR